MRRKGHWPEMRFVFYTHSLVSDWNHGNAHFLRGVMRELQALGHETLALEPQDGWSRQNLVREQGEKPLTQFRQMFPGLESIAYGPRFHHERAVGDADVVVVHEWTEPALVKRLGRIRKAGGDFTLIFHDTHHRAVSQARAIASLDLDGYDLVLAFGEALRQRYLAAGWGRRVVTWHEAADTALFHPMPQIAREKDLVWIGNWGDGERAGELHEFLIDPARRLRLSGTVHGVRYPPKALAAIRAAGLAYKGWLANADAPPAFARHRMSVHVPRRPYVEALPGIPTIRVFETLACGIPLICAPWEDSEGLFRAGEDYLVARDGSEMEKHMRAVLNEQELAASLASSGLETIRARHSCAHRVRELLQCIDDLRTDQPPARREREALP
jgi:spore maturation protein CgeB